MRIIVLDLEASKHKFRGGHCEILEIGAVKLDENLKTLAKFKALVKPRMRYNLKNLELDGEIRISKTSIENGGDITNKMNNFVKWINYRRHPCDNDYVIATWSNSDIQILIDNYSVTQYDLSWMKNYINVQKCFDDFIGAKRQTSLVNACKIIDKAGISVFNHRALSDAQLTAMVLKYLINNGYKFIYEKNPFVGMTCKIKYNAVK